MNSKAADRKDFLEESHVVSVFESDEDIKHEEKDEDIGDTDYARALRGDYFKMLELSLNNNAKQAIPNGLYFLPMILQILFNKLSLCKST